MNKLLALALLGFVLVALAGAEEAKETAEVEALEAREVRAAPEVKKEKKVGGKAAKKGKAAGQKSKTTKGKQSKKAGKKSGKKASKKAGKKASKKAGKKASKKSGKKASKKSGKKASKKSGKKASKKAGKKASKKAGKKSAKAGRQSTGCLPDTCLDTAVIYLSLLRSKASTITAQINRITRFNSTGNTKGKKTNNFNPVLGLLVDSAGGNASAPSCGGATTGAGASQLKNLTSTLASCPTDIAAACTLPPIPASFSSCNATISRFSANVYLCLNMTVNASAEGPATCSCWSAANLSADVAAVKACNLLDTVNSLQGVSQNCTKTVINCNKYQQDAPAAMHACNQNPSALLSKLQSLKSNQNATTQVLNKVNALLGGGSGKMAAMAKRAPSTTCAGVANDAKTYLSTLNANPASTALPTLAANVLGAGAVTCSDADKASLTSVASGLSSAIAAIVQQIGAVQSSLQVLTGTTASETAIGAAKPCSDPSCNPAQSVATATATTVSVATKAPAGHRRRRVVEDILREKLM